MNTEQKQRIEQIRKNRRIWYGGMGELTKDFDDLLSIVDEWESHREGLVEAATTAENAVELMRSLCVETVNEFDGWEWCKCSECRADARSHAVDCHASLSNLAKELESLSIQEQKS